MRKKDESKFEVISDEINRFMILRGRIPSQRELSEKVGLGRSAVNKYLKEMRVKGLIKGTGCEISTKETQLIPIPVVDTLHNNKHIYDNAEVNDYVFVSRKIYGEGEFGIVRAIDDSMSKMNININNFVMVRRQQNAIPGQIVLVKSDGKFLLRHFVNDAEQKESKLVSESNSVYEEVTDYEIRGVVLSVISHYDDDIVARYIQKLKLK